MCSLPARSAAPAVRRSTTATCRSSRGRRAGAARGAWPRPAEEPLSRPRSSPQWHWTWAGSADLIMDGLLRGVLGLLRLVRRRLLRQEQLERLAELVRARQRLVGGVGQQTATCSGDEAVVLLLEGLHHLRALSVVRDLRVVLGGGAGRRRPQLTGRQPEPGRLGPRVHQGDGAGRELALCDIVGDMNGEA